MECVMALKIVRGKNLPIGVDLGTSSAKLAQLRQVDKSYELIAAEAEEVPVAYRQELRPRLDYLADSLRHMVKSKVFRGRQAVLSLPAELTFVHHLKIPRVPEAEMPRILRAELQGKLPYDADDAVIRHVIAGELPGEGDGKQEVIVICAQRSVLESCLAMTRRARLDVVGVNVEPCAMVECFSRLFRREADANRTLLFIDMGFRSTQVVFAHGSQIVFARNLRVGGVSIDETIAKGLEMTPEQAHSLRKELLKGELEKTAEDEVYRLLDATLSDLGNELNKCTRYYESIFRNRAVERAIFLGGQAYDKRLCQALAQRLNLPAQVGDPLLRVKRLDAAGLNKGLDQREPQPDWAVAVGLSIGSVQAA
jgi:type IV pilus assembly protein PilM